MKLIKEVQGSKDKNYTVHEVEGGKIAFVFDPKKKLGASKSGKTQIISTTSGAIKVGDITLSMNVYTKE